MKAGIYIRVSTNKESQETSLEYQELSCKDYANSLGYTVVNVYKDIYTATKTGNYNKRPEYKKLIQDAISKKINVILVKDLSRLSRNEFELGYVENHLLAKNFDLISISDGINSITGNMDLFKVFRTYYPEESKAISLRTKQSKKIMAKKGNFIGSLAPYGYININGKLVIRDDESPDIVRNIFEDYISGKSAEAIARNLTEENIPTPSQLSNKKNASRKWHATTIRNMLINEHYIGNLVQGKTEAVNTLHTNRVNNPKSNYIVVEETHDAIVSKEQFKLVQDIIKSRKPNTKVSKKTHLLSNLIYCETCGKAISLRDKYYTCSTRLKHGKKICCTEKIKKIDLVNLLTKNIIDKIDNSDSDFLLNYIEKRLNKSIRKSKSTLTNLHIEKNRLENMRKRAFNMHLDCKISIDEYNIVITELDNKINDILKNIQYIESMLVVKDNIDLQRDFNLLKSKIIKSASLNPQILNYFIKKIEITKSGEPKIYYRFLDSPTLYVIWNSIPVNIIIIILR